MTDFSATLDTGTEFLLQNEKPSAMYFGLPCQVLQHFQLNKNDSQRKCGKLRFQLFL